MDRGGFACGKVADMKSMFDYEGYLNRVLTKVMYIVAVNLLFILCSLPVFTAGASCCAMYTVLFRYMQKDEPDIVRTFLREFKGNFKKATLIWAGMLGIGVTLMMNYYILYHMEGGWTEGIRVFLNLVLLLLAITGVYVYPAMAYYQNSVWGYLQFAIRAAIANLPVTAAVILIWAVSLLGILFLAQFLPMAVLLLICCGFSLPAYLSGHLLLRIWKKYGEETASQKL